MIRPWRRRNYFVKKELQGRYLFIAFVFAVTELVLFAILLGASQASKFTVSYDNGGLRVDRAPAALLDQILGVHWVFIVAGGLAVALAALFLSHRFAGPLYRFEQTLRQMIEGNLGAAIRLRTHDEGQELAELLNRFNSELSAALAEARDAAEAAGEQLRRASEAADPGELRVASSLAEDASRRVSEILARYERGRG